jgi:hypothetical protein
MKRSNWQFLLSLAVCAVLPLMVMAKQVIERPFKAHGHSVVAIDLSQAHPEGEFILAPCWVVEERGLGTHTGWWTSQGEGTVYFDLDLNPVNVTASGFITVASGEVITWDQPSEGLIILTGGTGRFANVSGSFTEVFHSMVQDQVGWIVYLSLEWTASGTIAY